jgi:hypothetical protein
VAFHHGLTGPSLISVTAWLLFGSHDREPLYKESRSRCGLVFTVSVLTAQAHRPSISNRRMAVRARHNAFTARMLEQGLSLKT